MGLMSNIDKQLSQSDTNHDVIGDQRNIMSDTQKLQVRLKICVKIASKT